MRVQDLPQDRVILLSLVGLQLRTRTDCLWGCTASRSVGGGSSRPKALFVVLLTIRIEDLLSYGTVLLAFCRGGELSWILGRRSCRSCCAMILIVLLACKARQGMLAMLETHVVISREMPSSLRKRTTWVEDLAHHTTTLVIVGALCGV